jgi:hypothetical protein
MSNKKQESEKNKKQRNVLFYFTRYIKKDEKMNRGTTAGPSNAGTRMGKFFSQMMITCPNDVSSALIHF